MQALTPYTSVTAERVMDKILEARARGYASLDQEAVIGNLSIATPVFDRSRSAVAALGISGAAAKFSITEFEREFAAVLRLTAHAITTASGGLMP
jgi:IclR family pca regulon transcriptional regulator